MAGKKKPTDYAGSEWNTLRASILERDGHRCRNCGSEKELTVHHWRPIAAEMEGISTWGYSTNGDPLTVPLSGLVTVCLICHGSLTAARERIKIRDDVSNLPSTEVPLRDWHNIFEVWDMNGRELPFKVIRQSWNPSADQYFLVEKVEIRNWPYGFAWGRYVRDGNIGEQEKIGSAGSYQWRKVE